MPLRHACRPAATLALLAIAGGASPAAATPVPLDLVVRHAGGVVATSQPGPPMAVVAATTGDALMLDAMTAEGLHPSTGYGVESEVTIDEGRVTWTLREVAPAPWAIVQPALTPLDATASLGELAAGDYELTAEFFHAGAPIGAAPMTFGTASFTVVPEPAAASLAASCLVLSLGRRRRR
ncbi:MAG: hypothetical protein AAF805_09470 [Planctomycetota bacterium]